MPTMKFGHAEYPIQWTDPNRQVRMLVGAMNDRKDVNQREYWQCTAEKHNRRKLHAANQQQIDGVEARGIEPL